MLSNKLMMLLVGMSLVIPLAYDDCHCDHPHPECKAQNADDGCPNAN